MTDFKEVRPQEWMENAFTLFDTQRAVLTAGDRVRFNSMTLTWGSLGMSWNKPTAIIFVKPENFTYSFLRKYDRFTLSFFGLGNQRDALRYLGEVSGREEKFKLRAAGLNPLLLGNVAAVAEAATVLVCRKVYDQPLQAENLLYHRPPDYDEKPEKSRDIEHEMRHIIISHIEQVLVRG